MGRQITPKEKLSLVKRYKAGELASVIAKDLGINTNTVRNWLKKAGITFVETKRVVLRTDWPAITTLLDSGDYTLEQVGKIFGVSRERIRQIYRRATGKKTRERINKKTEIRKKRLEKEGAETKFICDGCGKKSPKKDSGKMFCLDCRKISKGGKDPRIKLTCKRCGKIYNPSRSYPYLKYESKYCGKKCGGGRDRKLSHQSTREIVAMYSTGAYTQTFLAKEYGVSLMVISKVVRGKYFK